MIDPYQHHLRHEEALAAAKSGMVVAVVCHNERDRFNTRDDLLNARDFEMRATYDRKFPFQFYNRKLMLIVRTRPRTYLGMRFNFWTGYFCSDIARRAMGPGPL